MNITTTIEGATLKIAIDGRLGANTVGQLDEVLKSNLDGITELDFDFTKLEYLSSAGLRLLLTTQKRMNKQGCMKIYNANDSVMEIFKITGFVDILTLKKTN